MMGEDHLVIVTGTEEADKSKFKKWEYQALAMITLWIATNGQIYVCSTNTLTEASNNKTFLTENFVEDFARMQFIIKRFRGSHSLFNKSVI